MEGERVSRKMLYLRAFIRVVWVFMSNFYAIPAYLLLMVILKPLSNWIPDFYYYLEGVLFRWLQCMVGHWLHSAGYKVAECGDDMTEVENEEALILFNHQSTADVPAVMYGLQFHGKVLDKVFWVMDKQFKFTNFGIISQLRGDFFIQQGKKTRAMQGPLLSKHIKEYYIPQKRKWIVVFPEGGFLYKQKERSQAYSKKNDLPYLEHCTLPRVGAVHAILKTLLLQDETEGSPLGISKNTLKWVVDVTVAYPNGKPLDLVTIFTGIREPMVTIFHYRKYPIAVVPMQENELLQWMYARYVEKEKMLDIYYKTGKFPTQERAGDASSVPQLLEISAIYRYGLQVFYLGLAYTEVYIIYGLWTFLSNTVPNIF